jgi:osmotically-inducible protein OsmY
MKFTAAFITMLAFASFAIAQNTPATPQSGTSSAIMTNSAQTAASNSGESNSTDAQQMQQLQSQFSQDPAFENVQVSVTNHTALLTGTVASKNDRTRAEQLAKSLKGIRNVKDDLTVNANAGKSSNNPTTASGAGTPNGTSATATTPSASGEANTEQARNPNNATNPPTQSQATPSTAPASNAPVTSGGVTGAIAGPPASNIAPMATTPGAIGANAGAATPNPGASSNIESIENASTLQGQIQNALQNEPTLRNETVNVNVTESTIELSGAVQTGKEKQTADRIANSFAGNRRVRDRIIVGKGSFSGLNPNSSDLGTNPARPNQAPSSRPNQNSQNPSSNNPAANGDASSNPR